MLQRTALPFEKYYSILNKKIYVCGLLSVWVEWVKDAELLSLSRPNDDTPFGLYTQDRIISFRFGIEVITVSCRSHVP
jgi:hypothetical protein